MRGGSTPRAQYAGVETSNNAYAVPNRRRPLPERAETPRPAGRRPARKAQNSGVYARRRMLAVSMVLLGVLVLVFAAFAQTSGAGGDSFPIDPNKAGPDAVLAEVAEVGISSPVRPEEVTGLGYHPEGESLVEMSPRGKNLSSNPLLGLFSNGSGPEKIQYHLMDPARRQGPQTGALDVGAEAGAAVYAPVTGTVTAIRPDPALQEDASVVEIKPTVKPTENPDVRISVSLVQGITSEVGPKSPVTAGITQLGSVADSAGVLRPQLADYVSETGNHVTVSASRTA
jgi:hypothetical protein